MSDKVFTTYDKQIELLINRGINISKNDKTFAYEVLKKVGYYSLINGYKEPFIDKTYTSLCEHYKNGTTLQEIYGLYEFDRVLREIFMSFILKFEKHIKSLISYHFSEKYGYDNYLLYKNFDTKARSANIYIPELISEINRQVVSRTKDPCISHYLTTYGYIPLWVLSNILTFGTISKFYDLLKISEKTAIAREFNIQPKVLENFLKYLSAIRNFCAHGNRLFCYSTKKSLIDTTHHQNLNIPMVNNNYMQGKRDLFAAVIALKTVLSNSDYKRLKKKIRYNIKFFSSKSKILTTDELLNIMGFPDNWTNL